MSLALERLLTPATAHPGTPAVDDHLPRLNVTVVFTGVEATLAALKTAAALASRLSCRITLVVPQVVPFPLPLSSPPVLLDWNERRFHVIASTCSVETTVRIYLCRDRGDALEAALSPGSLVVVGEKKHWWFSSAEKRLARKLRRAGHQVILTEME